MFRTAFRRFFFCFNVPSHLAHCCRFNVPSSLGHYAYNQKPLSSFVKHPESGFDLYLKLLYSGQARRPDQTQ
jgi:hypothetical protein